jgi:hypothetical protein
MGSREKAEIDKRGKRRIKAVCKRLKVEQPANERENAQRVKDAHGY